MHISINAANKSLSISLGNNTWWVPHCTGKNIKKAPSWSETVLFIELILLTVALNFGPNVSTFVLPVSGFLALL